MKKNVMPFFYGPQRECILSIYHSLTSAVSETSLSNSTNIRFSYVVEEDRFYEGSLHISILKNQKEFCDILSEKLSRKLSHLKINFFDFSDLKLCHFDFETNSFFFTEQQSRVTSKI